MLRRIAALQPWGAIRAASAPFQRQQAAQFICFRTNIMYRCCRRKLAAQLGTGTELFFPVLLSVRPAHALRCPRAIRLQPHRRRVLAVFGGTGRPQQPRELEAVATAAFAPRRGEDLARFPSGEEIRIGNLTKALSLSMLLDAAVVVTVRQIEPWTTPPPSQTPAKSRAWPMQSG